MLILATNPVADRLNLAVASGGSALVTFQVSAHDTDDTLPRRRVTAQLDWGDGSPVEELGTVEPATPDSPLVATVSRLFPAGVYNLKLRASNLRSPAPDRVLKVLTVSVESREMSPSADPVVTGPILPKDDGTPNKDQWLFDTGDDTAVLVSSVKMLLVTSPGDRVMMPAYGVNLKPAVFELDPFAAELLAREEISRAFSIWEPRVALVSVRISKLNRTSVVLELVLQSKLSRQNFTVSSTLTA